MNACMTQREVDELKAQVTGLLNAAKERDALRAENAKLRARLGEAEGIIEDAIDHVDEIDGKQARMFLWGSTRECDRPDTPSADSPVACADCKERPVCCRDMPDDGQDRVGPQEMRRADSPVATPEGALRNVMAGRLPWNPGDSPVAGEPRCAASGSSCEDTGDPETFCDIEQEGNVACAPGRCALRPVTLAAAPDNGMLALAWARLDALEEEMHSVGHWPVYKDGVATGMFAVAAGPGPATPIVHRDIKPVPAAPLAPVWAKLEALEKRAGKWLTGEGHQDERIDALVAKVTALEALSHDHRIVPAHDMVPAAPPAPVAIPDGFEEDATYGSFSQCEVCAQQEIGLASPCVHRKPLRRKLTDQRHIFKYHDVNGRCAVANCDQLTDHPIHSKPAPVAARENPFFPAFRRAAAIANGEEPASVAEPECAHPGCNIPAYLHPARTSSDTRKHEWVKVGSFVQCPALQNVDGARCVLPVGHVAWHRDGTSKWRLAEARAKPETAGPGHGESGRPCQVDADGRCEWHDHAKDVGR